MSKMRRTYHLPWSPGRTSDDKVMRDTKALEGLDLLVTEKMDGENTTFTRDRVYARSLDSVDHPSRHWVKALHASIRWNIPEGTRILGENLFARHSIGYDDLESYYLVFGMVNNISGRVASWEVTEAWCKELGLAHVPIIYRHASLDAVRYTNYILPEGQEGYVVRPFDRFLEDDWAKLVGKYVRKGHVQTDDHWMYGEVVKNGVKK